MEAARDAIKDFTSSAGKHDTTVHESTSPAVTHELKRETQHEAAATAVDREIHQHHHHTSIQPVQDREVLPEKHHHNIVPVEHREHHHGDSKSVEQSLAAEAAQFKNITKTGETEHTHEVLPVTTGEHVHHHVHETIQPVIQKETIQPNVIHTVVPVHEVHHNEPKHHAATALPAMSMADFKKQGGSLTGGAERQDRFEGEPSMETAQQHGHHGGSHRHGFASTTGADDAARTRDVGTNERLDRRHDHEGAKMAAVGAGTGAAGAAIAEKHHHDHENQTHERRLGKDAAVGAGTGTAGAATAGSTTNTNTATTTSTAGSNDSPHTTHHNKLQKPAVKQQQQEYADTHKGSKMDTVGNDHEFTADGKEINASHHHSNFEAANVTKDSVPAEDATGEGVKKHKSLLERLNPLKDHKDN